MTMSRLRESDPQNVVPIDRGRRRTDPGRVIEFAETARRLQREREAAGDQITRLLRDTPRDAWPALAELEELHTSGVLDRLSSEVAALLEREPLAALAAANLASAIAEVLPADSYPPVLLAQMRAQAWKDRAQALSYLGRRAEAIEAVDQAERLLSAFGSLAHDRAIVRLVKALALQHLQRFDESLRLLEWCRAVFFDHGDAKRQLHCGMAEGTLLFRRGRFDAARDVFVSLLDCARGAGDLEMMAGLHCNIGHCSVHVGEAAVARLHFTEAMRHFEALGDLTNALRVDLGFGRVLLARGETANGLATLRQAHARFRQHGMVEEAGLCGLDIVAVLLDDNRIAEARSLATEIAEDYEQLSCNPRATEALRYLEERLEAHDASAVVRHVHSYLEALRLDPSREFVAYT